MLPKLFFFATFLKIKYHAAGVCDSQDETIGFADVAIFEGVAVGAALAIKGVHASEEGSGNAGPRA